MVQSLLMEALMGEGSHVDLRYDVAAIDRSKRRLTETEANRADIEAGC